MDIFKALPTMVVHVLTFREDKLFTQGFVVSSKSTFKDVLDFAKLEMNEGKSLYIYGRDHKIVEPALEEQAFNYSFLHPLDDSLHLEFLFITKEQLSLFNKIK